MHQPLSRKFDNKLNDKNKVNKWKINTWCPPSEILSRMYYKLIFDEDEEYSRIFFEREVAEMFIFIRNVQRLNICRIFFEREVAEMFIFIRNVQRLNIFFGQVIS